MDLFLQHLSQDEETGLLLLVEIIIDKYIYSFKVCTRLIVSTCMNTLRESLVQFPVLYNPTC
uniref:Uncharacterized protein n=1 Tax=Arion vulgaris TaxID=1028688 RepID=A0A0B7BA69_9EUPU